MRQIRPIEQSEGEDFLRVLCEVFDLDFKRAASIFFHEPMFDIDRKWALFEDGGIASILTTVPLEFGWGRAVWIAGVATIAQRQRQGLASELISEVLRHGAASGEAPALLFAKRPGLYESLGFECLDEVIRAQIRFRPEVPCEVLEFAEVRSIYAAWSTQDRNRLRRDERRWDYWRWNFRTCSRIPEGYLCQEGGLIRECLGTMPGERWPVNEGTEWLGLASMAERLGVPMDGQSVELHLMGHNFPAVPQLFMTDQF